VRFLVFQHLDVEHPGIFRRYFGERGIVWDTVELDRGDAISNDLTAYDALAVFGGPMDVWEETEHPWLKAEKQAILAVISRMEVAWNRGDFRGYMEGFANPDVIFVSRGQFQKDWQGTLDHYIRDYGTSEQTRGKLHFFDIKIEILGPDAAQLISRYQLDRPKQPQDGINTRLMRKRAGKWVIALNHVSSREIQ